GSPEPVMPFARNVGYPTPLDARTVLFVAPAEDRSGPWLWALDLDRKVERRISFGVERYTSIAATSDGHRLVASVSNPVANLWTIPILDRLLEETDVKPYPVPNVRALAPRFSGDSLFYLSSQSGGDGLWRFQTGRADEISKSSEGALFQPAAIS